MKISSSWLKEYVDHPYSLEELSHALTMSGLEVEQTAVVADSLDGVTVGRVLEVLPHPNADRLTVCCVDVGHDSPLQIICGAPNVAAGQHVAVARAGAKLMLPSRETPGETVPVIIRKAKIRGKRSQGMICAEDELGLSDDHSGIMVLTDDAEVGETFDDYLCRRGLFARDAMLDIAVTPNRPDAICHIGVARDVAALTSTMVVRPNVELPRVDGETARQVIVDIKCPEACRRYVALLVLGVTIRDSPPWLKQRLESVGLRSINNVVDITNYVMYECGQPLHAFDYNRIRGGHIVVRQSTEGERFTTLDGKDHVLMEGTVLICDAERSVALGGMMGGANSEVDETTTNVLIESAWFDPSTTRRAARKLGLSTDASYRFERGVDSDGQVWAAARAARLMVDLGGGTLVSGMVDAHPNPIEMPVLELRLARMAQVLGIDVPRSEVVRILRALEFRVDEAEGDILRCRVPTHRPDVEREIDIIEEVARIYGYDAIAEPPRTPLPSFVPSERQADLLRSATNTYLVGRGYREIVTNSLLRKDEAERFIDSALGRTGPVVETLNAVSQSMTTLRPRLLPGMLRVIEHNQNHGQRALRFYEFGHVFQRTNGAGTFIYGYDEGEAFIMGVTGPDAPTAWDRTSREADIFDLKGDVEAVFEQLRVPRVVFEAHNEASPLTDYRIMVYSGGVALGSIARFRADLRTPVYFAEFDWAQLVHLCGAHASTTYRATERHPTVERDIAVVVAKSEAVGPMTAAIRKSGGPMLKSVEVFDLYQGERIGADVKSVAFALRFGAGKTLKDEEVDHRVSAIVRRLAKTFGAKLRQ